MGQQQPKESNSVVPTSKIQGTRQQAQGDAKWDDIPEVNRVGAKFGDPHNVNPAYAKGGTGASGNPGKPV